MKKETMTTRGTISEREEESDKKLKKTNEKKTK